MLDKKLPLHIKLKIFLKNHLAKIWPKFHVAPRYYIVIPCDITISGKDLRFQAAIVNISESGLFVETDKANLLPKGKLFTLHFNFKEEQYALTVESVSDHTIIGTDGIGAKFISDKFHGNSIEEANKLLEVIKEMKPPVPVQE